MKASNHEIDQPEAARRYIARHRRYSILIARALDRLGCHKEICNRYLEPHGKINLVMTSGRPQLLNFFALRVVPNGKVNKNAERLAVAMARVYRDSQPRLLYPGEWHLPFVGDEQRTAWPLERQIARSVAACGWTSYRTADGRDSTWEDEGRMHDMLVDDRHMTPAEHQLEARADSHRNGGPVPGYNQYRHMIPGESATEFDFSLLDQFP